MPTDAFHPSDAHRGWRSLAASPTAVATSAVAVLTLSAWGALFAEAARAGGGAEALIGAICRPAALDGGLGVWSVAQAVAISAGFWVLMAVGMMLPTAAPVALAYADLAEARAREGRRSPSPLALIAGYLSVWCVVAGLAAVIQAIAAWGWPLLGAPEKATGVLAGFAVGAAGLYQFTEFKQRCLNFCRLPAETLREGMSERAVDVFRMGVRQGVQCLGCCGATMALMLLAGAMNLLWMGLLAFAATVEKLTPGQAVPRAIGVIMVASGVAIAVAAVGPQLVLQAVLAR